MAKVRVLVADGESLFRERVCVLLKGHEDIEVAGEATNGRDTIERVRELAPDVLLMNIALLITDGTGLIHRIRKDNGDTKVLLLIQYEYKGYALSGFEAGADGCIPKGASASELVWAILTLHSGGCFLHPFVTKTFVREYLRRKQNASYALYNNELTDREKEVLKLIVKGYKSREIANFLCIVPKTVQRHRANIYNKLDIHSTTELIKYAIRKHMVEMEG